jgi:hypothetical protein
MSNRGRLRFFKQKKSTPIPTSTAIAPTMPPAMAGAFDLGNVGAAGGEIEEVGEDCDREPETVEVLDAIAKSGLLKIGQSFVQPSKHKWVGLDSDC